MSVPELIGYHLATLERDEVKHGLIVNALTRAGAAKSADLSCWSLGRTGECAIKVGHHSIVLGALDENQCRKLADLTADSDYPGVIGPDLTASWFSDRAGEVGLQFLDPEPQQIYAISGEPRYPGSLGHARPITIEDASLLGDWLAAFHQEAVPHDALPSREELEQAAGEDRFLFWMVDGQPVSRASPENLSRHHGRLHSGEPARARLRRLRYRRYGRTHLCRGTEDCLPLWGPEKPGLKPLLHGNRVHASLPVAAFPQDIKYVICPTFGGRARQLE